MVNGAALFLEFLNNFNKQLLEVVEELLVVGRVPHRARLEVGLLSAAVAFLGPAVDELGELILLRRVVLRRLASLLAFVLLFLALHVLLDDQVRVRSRPSQFALVHVFLLLLLRLLLEIRQVLLVVKRVHELVRLLVFLQVLAILFLRLFIRFLFFIYVSETSVPRKGVFLIFLKFLVRRCAGDYSGDFLLFFFTFAVTLCAFEILLRRGSMGVFLSLDSLKLVIDHLGGIVLNLLDVVALNSRHGSPPLRTNHREIRIVGSQTGKGSDGVLRFAVILEANG